jgi:hypothetical protein
MAEAPNRQPHAFHPTHRPRAAKPSWRSRRSGSTQTCDQLSNPSFERPQMRPVGAARFGWFFRERRCLPNELRCWLTAV